MTPTIRDTATPSRIPDSLAMDALLIVLCIPLLLVCFGVAHWAGKGWRR